MCAESVSYSSSVEFPSWDVMLTLLQNNAAAMAVVVAVVVTESANFVVHSRKSVSPFIMLTSHHRSQHFPQAPQPIYIHANIFTAMKGLTALTRGSAVAAVAAPSAWLPSQEIKSVATVVAPVRVRQRQTAVSDAVRL
jgi:hypothetical protein